jgi:hypothetical protein
MAVGTAGTVAVNAVAGLISIAVELARANNMDKEQLDQIYNASYTKAEKKDPTAHPHPNFDEGGT